MAIRVAYDIEKRRRLIKWLLEQFESGKSIKLYEQAIREDKYGVVGVLRASRLIQYEVDTRDGNQDGPMLHLKGDTFAILKTPAGDEILIRKFVATMEGDGIFMSTDVGFMYLSSFPEGFE